jgi:hypothetical protein
LRNIYLTRTYQKLGGAIEASTGITEGITKLERKNEFNERTN